jgi:hypothetical protein
MSAPLVTFKHIDANVFITPNAVVNVAFAIHMLQHKFTYVDCGKMFHICFQHFHPTPLEALHLPCAEQFQFT